LAPFLSVCHLGVTLNCQGSASCQLAARSAASTLIIRIRASATCVLYRLHALTRQLQARQLRPATYSYKLHPFYKLHHSCRFFCVNKLQATTARWHTSPRRGQMHVAGARAGMVLTQKNNPSAGWIFSATASFMPALGGGTCSWGSPQPLSG